MKFEDVKVFLESEAGQSDEVSAYLKERNSITLDAVQEYVKSDVHGRSWLDSQMDKHLSKGLETWKANNLERLIEEEVRARFPEKDEKDIQVERLRLEVEQMKAEKLKEELTNKAMKIADAKKIPLEIAGFFIAGDEETTLRNLEVFESVYNESIQKTVEQRLKAESYPPPLSSSKLPLTLKQINSMSQQEINENWDVVKEFLMKEDRME